MDPVDAGARGTARAAGVAAVLAGFLLFAAVPLELLADRPDTDNAAASLVWLERNAALTNLTAGLQLSGGALLIVAVTGLALVMRRGHIGLPLASATVFGCFAGALFAAVGGIRSNTGAIQYIGGFDPDWAESAYLATHIIGLQSLLPVATIAASGWLIVVSVAGARRGLPWLLAIGMLPTVGLVMAGLAKFAPVVTIGDEVGVGWLLHIANILVGVPLGIVAVGIVLLIPRTAERFATAPRSTTIGSTL
ncbi:hypothetical protein [uncultured Microbacterium sp.]|uniref:DUF4386 family protein n=1 Tax=uncultured Microbacterium sp. TaxID=191216 RepID=A0A1Y5P6R9_9MICO|nr:hypothetical protein [uncultured Microbacterium sp.]SBS73009.1 membrane hypothetical protein [uncultured Microbacterium sp.]